MTNIKFKIGAKRPKVYIGQSLLYDSVSSCPSGQVLDTNTGECYDGFSVLTPTGTNVSFDVFPQRNDTSLGLSISFQNVVVEGTTSFFEFTTKTKGLPDFNGIQINTTCSFTGDLSFSFTLPPTISQNDFENLSITNLIDNTNITQSRNYNTKIITGKISTNQNLSIMSNRDPSIIRVGVSGPQDCAAGEDYCSYWSWGVGFIGDYIRNCYTKCKGTFNERDSNRGCLCKCPDYTGIITGSYNVCQDYRTSTWYCFFCNIEQIFIGQVDSNPNTPACQCRCPNVCSSGSQKPANSDPHCNCRCKNNYTKCGQRIINRTNEFGESYTTVDEHCCPPGSTCYPAADPNAPGKCCWNGTVACNNNTICCDIGKVCVNNECCLEQRVCGNACCTDTQTCVDGVCCDPGRICGNQCCKTNETCINGECCPMTKVCYDSSGQQYCCGAGMICDTSFSSSSPNGCVDAYVGGGFGQIDAHDSGERYWRWLYGNTCPGGQVQQPSCLDPQRYPNPNNTRYWVPCGNDGIMYPANFDYQIDWTSPTNFPVC